MSNIGIDIIKFNELHSLILFDEVLNDGILSEREIVNIMKKKHRLNGGYRGKNFWLTEEEKQNSRIYKLEIKLLIGMIII